MSFVKDLLTERDGESWDLGRLSWLLGVVFYLAATGFITWVKKEFDPMVWSAGFAAVLIAGAGAIKTKESTEQPFPKKD